ncbi:MAG: 4Fe-4S dicluster domain-containing protein [Pseudolabrys sp.]|jgi:sulfhydrogenase subunit beta (sulfur reductase)
MEGAPTEGTAKFLIACDGLQALIDVLAAAGYQVVGPTVREEAIVYDTIARIDDLPGGWTDRQAPGRYGLQRRDDGALFGFTVGPQAWKRFLHPPVMTMWRARKRGDEVTVESDQPAPPKFAFIGVRACEIAAIDVQDKVFCDGPYPDTDYAARRRDAFVVAVNCGQAGGTCFCVSMDTGPKAEAGFDLALTELVDGIRHEFLVEIGSATGAAMLKDVPYREAAPDDIAAAETIVARTANQMGRRLETDGIRELLEGNLNHPRWDEVAARCLTCGNCTMVCPTCFCTTVEDHSDLTGASAERVRKWDSCFTMDFSFISSGSVRKTNRARYRQWMTHKLATWIDQFGMSGCVGCGRCITWCPVGIDITEEAAAIRATPHATKAQGHGGT